MRFDYQGYCGWWAGQGNSVLVEGPRGRVLLHRDAEAELDAITRLMNLGLMSTDGGIFGIPGNTPQHTGCTGPTTATACCARRALP
jgi:hypothetical protein